MANNHFTVFAWFKIRKHFSVINTRRAAAAVTAAADAFTVWESLCAPDTTHVTPLTVSYISLGFSAELAN